MKGYLVITNVGESLMERSCVAEIVGRWRGHLVRENPFIAVIESDEGMPAVVETLNIYPYEWTVIELGDARSFKGIACP